MKFLCKCGCGKELNNLDSRGRKREYIKGHNQKNKQFSEIHKHNLSLTHPNVSGEKNPMWNKTHSNESKLKIAKTQIGRKHPKEQNERHSKAMKGRFCGEKSYNWKGGISTLTNVIRNCEKYHKWHITILQRDLFICQSCKKKSEGDLEAHHIKQFSKIIEENNIKTIEQALSCINLWDINNGITLCENCHKKIPIKG